MGVGVGGVGKGESSSKMGLVVITDIIYVMLINMLVDFHHFLLF